MISDSSALSAQKNVANFFWSLQQQKVTGESYFGVEFSDPHDKRLSFPVTRFSTHSSNKVRKTAGWDTAIVLIFSLQDLFYIAAGTLGLLHTSGRANNQCICECKCADAWQVAHVCIDGIFLYYLQERTWACYKSPFALLMTDHQLIAVQSSKVRVFVHVLMNSH